MRNVKKALWDCYRNTCNLSPESSAEQCDDASLLGLFSVYCPLLAVE